MPDKTYFEKVAELAMGQQIQNSVHIAREVSLDILLQFHQATLIVLGQVQLQAERSASLEEFTASLANSISNLNPK